MSIFYTLLDIIGVNAFTIFAECLPDRKKNNPNQRKLFLGELDLCLVKPHVSQRNTSSLHKDLVFGISSILCEKLSSTDASSLSSITTMTIATSLSMAASCGHCKIRYDKCFNYTNKQKTSRISTECCKCGIYVCKVRSHVNIVCGVCSENSDMSD